MARLSNAISKITASNHRNLKTYHHVHLSLWILSASCAVLCYWRIFTVRLLEPLFHADKVLTCYFVKSLQGHKMVSTSATYSTCHCHVMMGSDVIRSTAVIRPST